MTREFVLDGIRRHCLRNKDDRTISKSGLFQNWLIDLRPALLKPEILRAVAALFWQRFAEKRPFQLGTVKSAGIPLLTALLLEAPGSDNETSGFIIRKDRKTTGMGNIVEGALTSDPIILVDDIFNSGRSAEYARSVLASEGRSVSELFCIIDYHSREGEVWQRSRNIPVTSLFDLSEFDLTLKPPRPIPEQAYRELWRRGVPGGFPFYVVPKSTPILKGNRIYRGCDAGIMHAFDTATGNIVWAHEAAGASPRKGIWSTPTVHDGRLYYGAYNGVVYALEARTGQEIWSQSCCEWIGSSPLVLPEHNLLLIGLEYERPWAHGALTALNLQTGAKVWEHLVSKFEHGSASFCRGSDIVVWGTADHNVIALKPATGKVIWSFPTRRSVKYPAAIDEARKLVAFASFDRSIYLLDVETGDKRGEWLTNEICYTTPLFVGNRLFCGSGDRHLYVIDVDTGLLIRRLEFNSRIYSSPRLLGDRVIFGTTGGQVIEIDVESLEVKGSLRLPDAITNAVALSEDGKVMYVSSYMNHLFAFERLEQGQTPQKEAVAAEGQLG